MHKVRLAQIGVGYWGKNLLRNFDAIPACRVVAVCDADPGARQFVEDQYPMISITKDTQEILSRDDLDGIVIATETPSHFSLARTALESGRHVFVENPWLNVQRKRKFWYRYLRRWAVTAWWAIYFSTTLRSIMWKT